MLEYKSITFNSHQSFGVRAGTLIDLLKVSKNEHHQKTKETK